MKALKFYHRGTQYLVSLSPDTLGHIIEKQELGASKIEFPLPHDSWKILGVSYHHWRMGIDTRITENVNPDELNGGIVWDLDHGTTRTWSGQYMGKIPRIEHASIINV